MHAVREILSYFTTTSLCILLALYTLIAAHLCHTSTTTDKNKNSKLEIHVL